MSEPAWRVQGASEEGSPGQRDLPTGVVFAIGIKRDGTGWIAAEMEDATDAASLELSVDQLRGLRNALNNMLRTRDEDSLEHRDYHVPRIGG